MDSIGNFDASPRKTIWTLLCEGPYRLFFPWGIIDGLLGVGYWLFWSMGWVRGGNTLLHVTLQVEGFLTCFVVGFLLTALPRFLGCAYASPREILALLACAIALPVLALTEFLAQAYGVFIATLLLVGVFALRRLPRRKKNPPRSFILIAFGIFQGLLGASLVIASRFGSGSVAVFLCGTQMLQVGYMTTLVLGVVSYLGPFVMGYSAHPSCEPSIRPSIHRERLSLAWYFVVGAALALSFSMEWTHPRGSAAARAILVAAQLLIFARIARPVRNPKGYAFFFWIACWMVAAGLAFAALWPQWRIAGLHILFISGFSLMIFSFGLMVVLSHAEAPAFLGKLIPLRWIGAAVLIATVMRVLADVDVARNRAWLHMSAGTWMLAAGGWLVYVWPHLFRAPASEPLEIHTPARDL